MRFTLALALFASLLSCQENKSTPSQTALPMDQTKLIEKFINALSTQKQTQAFALLHPDLARPWTAEAFTKDFQSAIQNLTWQPIIIETATGPSPQGPYRKVIYRLEKDPLSRASLELMAMKSSPKNKIVKVLLRLPIQSEPKADLLSLSQKFEQLMRGENYAQVQQLFSDSSRKNFSPIILKQMKNALADLPQNNSSTFLRVLANSTWYDAIEIGKKNEPKTRLELIFSSDNKSVKIHNLTYKSTH